MTFWIKKILEINNTLVEKNLYIFNSIWYMFSLWSLSQMSSYIFDISYFAKSENNKTTVYCIKWNSSLVKFSHNFAVFSSAIWTEPFSLWLVYKSDTIEVKPLNDTSIIVTSYHFSVGYLFTQAVGRFIRINRRFNRTGRSLFFLCWFSLLFLLWAFVLDFL